MNLESKTIELNMLFFLVLIGHPLKPKPGVSSKRENVDEAKAFCSAFSQEIAMVDRCFNIDLGTQYAHVLGIFNNIIEFICWP